jgi:tRNA dimethylallyltransferase
MAKASNSHPPSSILHLRPIFLAGPTAVGKSEIALNLASRVGGEIISVDSMQVYRGLDIGTAKPTSAERARIAHHLIDVAELSEGFDAAKFVWLASEVAAEIRSRGRVPVFCGGTGLYFRAYLQGLGEAPPPDAALRATLDASPLSELLRELELRDPMTFAIIDRKNPRRVIRAVEVIRLTGRPFSEQRSKWNNSLPKTESAPRIFAFTRGSADLHSRISARVDTMFLLGLVDEVRRLLTRGLEKNPTAMQAIGYRQVVEHLRGERGLAETIELIKARTRQFSKRQMTWFRSQPNTVWIELNTATNRDQIVDQILSRAIRADEVQS